MGLYKSHPMSIISSTKLSECGIINLQTIIFFQELLVEGWEATQVGGKVRVLGDVSTFVQVVFQSPPS